MPQISVIIPAYNRAAILPRAVDSVLKQKGVEFVRAKVGDRYVLELLNEKGWMWGGENSGHIICLDCHTTGDGIVSALQVLAALKRAGKSLGEYSQELKLFPQVLVNVRTQGKLDSAGHPGIQAAVGQAEKELAGAGRVLLRASGTEPLIRVMVEGADAEQVSRLAESIAVEVRKAA